MKTCILLGDRSDIAKALLPQLVADGWTVHGWNRDGVFLPVVQWDLFLCAIGRVSPVGPWHKQSRDDIAGCVNSNLLLPIELLRVLWPKRNKGASVCMMAGANPNHPMDGYLAYALGKMALLKFVEHADQESQDTKIFAVAPGYVRDSKIHAPSLEAMRLGKVKNYRIERGDAGTPIERIHKTIMWAVSQDKAVIGGRNLCASDDWDTNQNLADELRSDNSKFKLRRIE